MKKTITTKITAVLLVLVQFVATIPAMAVGASAAAEVPMPFACSNSAYQPDGVDMGGIHYSGGVLFTMGYTGISNGNTAVATYNLKGQYSSFSFKAGYVSGDERNAKMTVTADGATLYDGVELNYESIARSFTLSVGGVEQLVFKFESGGYDKTRYAVSSVSVTAVGNTDSDPMVSDEFFDIPRYKFLNASRIDGDFTMGGYDYTNGYKLQMGYTGSSDGHLSKVCFNFNNQYRRLDFDIAKLMVRANEPYTCSAKMTITADGVALSGYSERELKWNDIVHHVTVNLNGVSELIITLDSSGYDKVNWAIGDVQLVSDGKAHGVLLASDKATLTSSAPTFDLDPRVYPSDASNKNYTVEYDPPIVIMMDDDIAYGRSAGNATVTVTTEQGGYESVCKITSKLPAAKYIPSEDAWGFHNYPIDWSEFTSNFDYYAKTYERVSGRALSYALDNVTDVPYTMAGLSSFDAMSQFADGVDAAWYIGMSSAMTGLSSLFGGSGAGQCHGLSVSSALTYTGDLPFSGWDISEQYQHPYDIKSISNKTGYSKSLDLYLKQLIFGCHITQVGTQDLVSGWTSKNKFDKLFDAVRNFRSTGKDPVAITLDKPNASHTMLAYDVLEINEFLLLFVYDPNITSHDEPDNTYLVFMRDDNGEVINWKFEYPDADAEDNYYMNNTDITFSTGLSAYAKRIKAKEEIDTAKKFFITTVKDFFIKKDGNTLISYADGRYDGNTDQSIVVPVVMAAGARGNSDVAIVALTETAGVTVVTDEGGVTAYYDEDSATVIETGSPADIDVTPGVGIDTVKVKPARKGDISIRYNSEDGGVIAQGTATSVTVSKDDETNKASFTGFESIVPTTIDTDGNKKTGTKTSTSKTGSYSVDDGKVVTSRVLPFTDVADGAWYYDAVAYCYKNKVFNGTSATTFSPDVFMSRAMFVRTLANIDGVDLSRYTKTKFTDVKDGEWYATAVNWAADKKIVSGTSETTFSPNTTLTREQMAAILYRYAEYKRQSVKCDSTRYDSFADKDTVSDWAVQAMTWMTYKGYISGTSTASGVLLSPRGTSTRSQAARVLMVFIQE